MSAKSPSATALAATPFSAVVDTSDVPTVAARELALALKLLSGAKVLFIPEHALSEGDLRRAEQTFWQFSKRDRTRKVAVLLRFRGLLEACQSRRLNALLARHGQDAMVHALSAAATMRLNAKWGFNPHKMARAVSEALSEAAGLVQSLPAAA
jgi:hypothetical protein